MAGQSGTDYRLLVHDGATYATVGQEQNTSVDLEIDTSDTTNKDSGEWSEQIQTIRSMSVDSDGIFESGDTAIQAIEGAYFSNSKLSIKVVRPSGSAYQSSATLDTFSTEGSYDGSFDYSVSVSSDGTVNRI